MTEQSIKKRWLDAGFAEAAGRATAEQREFLERPEAKALSEQAAKRCAPILRRAYEHCLEHPELFAPQDRPAVRQLRRAESIASPAVREREVDKIMRSHTGRRSGRAARPATNERRRGGRRGERATSSSSDDPDGDAEPHRTCQCGCGASLDHKRRNARYLSHTHAVRAHRAAEREEWQKAPAPVVSERHRPTCAHSFTVPDLDGDPVCIACGALIGTPSSPNGHELVLALMVTDADGQRYRVLRKRHIGSGRWGGLATRLPSDAVVRPQPVRTSAMERPAKPHRRG